MKIDAHQHFWRYAKETHGWIDDSMRALRRDFLPPDLQPLLDAAGFDGCVAVQAQQDVAETEWLLGLAEEYAFICGVVGWVELCGPEVEVQVARLASRRKLRGVRYPVQDEPDDRFMLQPSFMRGIAALAPFGLTYDILIYARQLPAAVELARAFPDQRFVLDHIAKPDIRGGEMHAWSKGIAAIARSKNVWCKLSGIVTEAKWSELSAESLSPHLDVVFDWFDPSHLMIGSDWPVCLLAASYADAVGLVSSYVARRAPAYLDAVMGETAAACYGLEGD